MAKRKKYGGRKAGTPNKASADRQARVAAEGPTPLNVQIYRMRYYLKRHNSEVAKPDHERRITEVERLLDKAGHAAALAAPLVHPTFKAVAHIPQRDPMDIMRLLLQEIAEQGRNENQRLIEGTAHEIERTE